MEHITKLMLSLPRETHKYMIEPLSKIQHIMFSLRKRFLKFVACVAQSEKRVLRNVLNAVKLDCRSVTGRNLRTIMITTNQNVYLKDFYKVTFDRPYCELPPGDSWRILLVQEILEAMHGELKVENFELKELDEIIRCACCT